MTFTTGPVSRSGNVPSCGCAPPNADCSHTKSKPAIRDTMATHVKGRIRLIDHLLKCNEFSWRPHCLSRKCRTVRPELSLVWGGGRIYLNFVSPGREQQNSVLG